MAEFCIVSPINILQRLADYDALGRYHLLLAHDVVKHPKEYLRLFNLRPRSTGLVILDNSAYELGGSVDFEMVKEAADIVLPNCIALPDYYRNKQATIAGVREAIDKWADAFQHFQLMVIPQGDTIWEWAECASSDVLRNDPRISWWGIPRNIVDYYGTRKDAIWLARSFNENRQIHMFGFSNNYLDDIVCSQMPFVYSIDSTTPLRAGSLDIPFSPTVDLPKRGNWWEEAQWNDLILKNLRDCRHIFRRK